MDLGLGEYPGGLGPGAEVKVFVPPGVGGSCLPGYPNQPLGFLVVLGSCHQCSSWLMGWYWSHIAYVCPVNWQGALSALRQRPCGRTTAPLRGARSRLRSMRGTLPWSHTVRRPEPAAASLPPSATWPETRQHERGPERPLRHLAQRL